MRVRVEIFPPELVSIDSSCQLQYLSHARAPENRSGALTVGEGLDFAQSGGDLSFVVKDDKVRFVAHAGCPYRR